jgi:hydroxypyruvate isomerase
MHPRDQRFDVNCSILFTELPMLKRPAAARSAGFDAVEFWWPFAEPVPADSTTSFGWR